MSAQLIEALAKALWETCYMVALSGIITLILGTFLGILLATTRPNAILARQQLHKILVIGVNGLRSIPFIILMVAIIPLTRLLTGTSIGTTAAIVPLSVAAIPFFGRIVEHALLEVPKGLLEAGLAMGASSWQLICRVLFPEALPAIIRGYLLTLVNLVGYTAMAGAIGGGGLGDLAIHYGYQRFDTKMMVATVVLLIALVQLLQYAGDRVVNRFLRH